MNHNDTHNTVKDQVLERITSERVAPRSRWYFFARHAALWLPGIVVTIIGAFAIAGILFSAVHAGWRYRMYTHPTLLSFLQQVIPLIWLIALVLFGALIVKTLRLTAHGYRYKTGVLLLGSFLASVVLGAALFALDMTVRRNAIIRFHSERMQRMIWLSPEHGRLAGVIAMAGDGAISMVDASGKRWMLDTSELLGRELLAGGVSARLIGEAQDDNLFFSCIAFPWELSPVPPPMPSAGVGMGVMVRVRMHDAPEELFGESTRCYNIVRGIRSDIGNERKLAP